MILYYYYRQIYFMKPLSKFVLLDSANKKQMFLEWKTNYRQNRTMQAKLLHDNGYSSRKNIMSQIAQTSNQQIIKRSISTQNQLRVSSSVSKLNINQVRANPQKIYSQRENKIHKTFYRSKSFGKTSHQGLSQNLVKKRYKNISVNSVALEKLTKAISMADQTKGKPICVMKTKRYGLRYKTINNFFSINSSMSHDDVAKHVKQVMFQQYSDLADKKIYFFHLNKEPINDVTHNLHNNEFAILADSSPKFDIPYQVQMEIFQQAELIEQKLKESMHQLAHLKHEFDSESKSAEPTKIQYQWQKIKNVKLFVDKIIENPILTKLINREKTQKDAVEMWYEEKYTHNKEQVKDEKNLFLDVQSHFPKETSQIDVLGQAAIKVSTLPLTINKHQLKQKPTINIMEKEKKEREIAQKLRKQQQEKIRTLGYKSEKQFTKQLDRKNIPLAYQNIPFMMEKYGITRAEAYNLYNLYKSLQKISAMRLIKQNEHRRVKQNGIDKKTFDECLKGLGINPGQQLVRNICYSPGFISWEEFIKIVSISMRKTPKSKLQAILQGLGSQGQGYLTKDQIDIMVGSSLQKIFGEDQPQLRKHFVNSVIKTMDKDQSGSISIEQLKAHVLQNEAQSVDLVSYLMLNN